MCTHAAERMAVMPRNERVWRRFITGAVATVMHGGDGGCGGDGDGNEWW